MARHGQIWRSIFISLWFMFLTFPIMVIRVRPAEGLIEWRWRNMFLVGIGALIFCLVERYAATRRNKAAGGARLIAGKIAALYHTHASKTRLTRALIAAAALLAIIFPFVFSIYQTSIMTTALMYAVLGLGLNIVVGLAGLLDLGYVAFFAVGAYSYGLLNHHFGMGFWTALPIGGCMGALFGILLGFPVLRLRGDYLAIVTLGFGEIIRLILENWNSFSFGPSGIANIPRPAFFGLEHSMQTSVATIYFLMLGLTLFTIIVVSRLRDSRIGRAWIALREDEIACQAMGIDRTRTKLTAFALGATWAGMAGVVFAAKTGFINPASFTFIESAIILSIVVLGGMGAITGVIIAAFILILLPEYLRAFSELRMLLFGAIMVLMMLFRPQGIISNVRHLHRYQLPSRTGPEENDRSRPAVYQTGQRP